MISAAKILNQEISIIRVNPLLLVNTSYQWVLHSLTMLIFISALALIVVTSQTRGLYKEIRQLDVKQVELNAEYEQLVLERSSLLTQARVASIAYRDLAMRAPDKKTLLVVDL